MKFKIAKNYHFDGVWVRKEWEMYTASEKYEEYLSFRKVLKREPELPRELKRWIKASNVHIPIEEAEERVKKLGL